MPSRSTPSPTAACRSQTVRLFHITEHALAQARDRWPTTLPKDREQRRHVLAEEVVAALDEGRYSTRRPAFALRDGSNTRTVGWRNRGERDRTLRYAWPADQNRLYLIDRRGDTIHVVTCIRPGEAITSAT